MLRTKSQLKRGEFLVVDDSTENYSSVLQDAAQSLCWNNLQATMHPFVCYYMNHSEAQDEATAQKKILDHVSFFVIFQSNLHDTVAVHLYQKMLIRFLTKIEDQTENHLFSRWMCSIIYE